MTGVYAEGDVGRVALSDTVDGIFRKLDRSSVCLVPWFTCVTDREDDALMSVSETGEVASSADF